ncbi:MAG: hypothetical protein M3O70_09020 [Actinomycetota bacterium]|nr:hypothetical protein [Actinomycetota bacterium]
MTTSKSNTEVVVPVERQKAAQAAGTFELTDLPPPLSEPAAAVRLGKSAKQDKPLKGVRSLSQLTKLHPGQVIANFGRSEARWASTYQKRRAGNASFMELLSYARQIVGLDEQGQVLVCLMGHAGQGPCIPLWVPEEEVTLTVQPNDIIMRFDEMSFNW